MVEIYNSGKSNLKLSYVGVQCSCFDVGLLVLRAEIVSRNVYNLLGSSIISVPDLKALRSSGKVEHVAVTEIQAKLSGDIPV